MVRVEEVQESLKLSPVKPSSTSTPMIKASTVRHVAVSSSANDARNRVLSYMAHKRKIEKGGRLGMVIEAIKAIGNDERGISIQAIIKFITASYEIVDVNKLKAKIKVVILKALDEQVILRSPNSKSAKGTSGSFVLGKTKGKGPATPKKKSEKNRKPRRSQTGNSEHRDA